MLGQIDDVLVVEKPGHYHVVISAENTSNILCWLSLAKLNVVGTQVERMATQFEEALNQVFCRTILVD